MLPNVLLSHVRNRKVCLPILCFDVFISHFQIFWQIIVGGYINIVYQYHIYLCIKGL